MAFDLHRRWRFEATPERLWDLVMEAESYRGWWPWLRELDPARLEGGTTLAATIRPPLPYTVRVRIHVEEVRARELVQASVSGDLVGRARLEIERSGDDAEVMLHFGLTPQRALLRRLHVVARPMLRWGHDWVVDAAIGQLERATGISAVPLPAPARVA
jgi:hypothetical protein